MSFGWGVTVNVAVGERHAAIQKQQRASNPVKWIAARNTYDPPRDVLDHATGHPWFVGTLTG